MQDPEIILESDAILPTPSDEWCVRVEKSVREEPAKAIGAAFAAGIFLTIFPVGRIMGGLVRLAFALVRPALLVLGVVKLAEEIDKRKKF